MKVSLQLANQYSNVDLLAINPNELLARIGAQLGAVEEVIDWSSRYNGLVVAKVVSCQKHDNADKLNVCLIDDGGVTQGVGRNSDGLVQVVCGAPNVRAGILVAWIPPGATVPSTIDKDPFVLSARELRGVVSNGMLASSSELGLSDDHTGILEITEVAPGTPFKQLYGLNDLVIDCENKMFTHRPDCFGVLGVARELAGITGQRFVSPDWYSLSAIDTNQTTATSLPVAGDNRVPEKVPRFMVQVVENVTVKPSPVFIQSALARLGSRPINNLVDLTNYYMHLTAQPTHAFDYDKVKAISGDNVTIFPRMAQEGEELALLNGKIIKLTAEDIVIATQTQAIALAGVMGGAATEVDANTKNIIIECANFDMYTVRRMSMRHGLFTDAVTRFNKGQSHLQNPVVLQQLVNDICQQTGATRGVIFDSAPEEDSFTWEPVEVATDFINARLGISLSSSQVRTLLENVEFTVEESANNLIVTPPFWRKDIEIAEDVVEEVGRLHGYDKLAVTLPRRSTAPVHKNPKLELDSRVRSVLSRAGANEVLTYSFVSGKLIESAQQTTKEAYQLGNALSPELQYYRLTLTPSLCAKIHQNVRAGYDQFALFEIGKTHLKLQGVNNEGLPQENQMLSLVYAANDKKVGKSAGASYYQARLYLDYLAKSLGLTLDYEPMTKDIAYEITRPFDWQRSALVTDRASGNYIGVIGEFKASVRERLKLPVHSAAFEIMLAPILDVLGKVNAYKPLAKFPHISQDMTLSVASNLAYSTLMSSLDRSAAQLSAAHGYVVTVEPRDIYHKEKATTTNFTFRFDIHHPERTLTTDEVNTFVDQVAAAAGKACKAKRV